MKTFWSVVIFSKKRTLMNTLNTVSWQLMRFQTSYLPKTKSNNKTLEKKLFIHSLQLFAIFLFHLFLIPSFFIRFLLTGFVGGASLTFLHFVLKINSWNVFFLFQIKKFTSIRDTYLVDLRDANNKYRHRTNNKQNNLVVVENRVIASWKRSLVGIEKWWSNLLNLYQMDWIDLIQSFE